MKNINFMSDEMINNIFLPNDDVLAEYEISGEFSEKILKSMGERRKKNEEKAQQKEKIHKNTFIRAAVIAAVITLMILVIPSSRQVVVNAAESVWEWLVKSNGSYSYEFDTIEFNPEISD